jgi:hypothetical protein
MGIWVASVCVDGRWYPITATPECIGERLSEMRSFVGLIDPRSPQPTPTASHQPNTHAS